MEPLIPNPFGLPVQVNRHLPPGTILVVSPDVMDRLRVAHRDPDALVLDLNGYDPARFERNYMNRPIPDWTYRPVSDTLPKGLLDAYMLSEYGDREAARQQAYVAELREQRLSDEWRRDWWHGGEERGWWE